MSEKVYLHLGMQKTGSTWLQGLVFPQITSHDVVHKESFRHLMYKLTNRDKIVSYENYVGYPHLVKSRGWNGWLKTRDSALKNLSKFFPDADVFLVVRKQSEFVGSMYNQYIKVGGSVDFDEYWAGRGEYSLERDALKYCDLIEHISSNFGGRILVVDFEVLKKDKLKFLEVFSDFVGGLNEIDLRGRRANKVNASLTPQQIRAMLFLSKYVGNIYGKESAVRVRQRVFKFFRFLMLNIFSVLFSKAPLVNQEFYDDIEDYYREDWEKISRCFSSGYFILEGRG